MHLKTKREFGVEMCCLREVILQSQGVNKSRHFRHRLIIISIDKALKIQLKYILNHPYLNKIYVSRINIELLSV